MRAKLIRIGCSRGVGIPKFLIKQCGLDKAVELRVRNDCMVISPERRPRQGWEEAFYAAGASTDGELLLERMEPNEFDRKEWQWPR